jgi:hypothetical protein
MKPFNNGSGKSIYAKQNYKTKSKLNNNDVDVAGLRAVAYFLKSQSRTFLVLFQTVIANSSLVCRISTFFILPMPPVYRCV